LRAARNFAWESLICRTGALSSINFCSACCSLLACARGQRHRPRRHDWNFEHRKCWNHFYGQPAKAGQQALSRVSPPRADGLARPESGLGLGGR
jgi:hypothetical protein